MVASFHYIVSHGQGATCRSPSLSRSNTWPLSSSWNPSALLPLVFELSRYPPSDVVLTPAISPITGRLVEGGNVVSLPMQIQQDLPTAHIIQYTTPPLQTSMCHIGCRLSGETSVNSCGVKGVGHHTANKMSVSENEENMHIVHLSRVPCTWTFA